MAQVLIVEKGVESKFYHLFIIINIIIIIVIANIIIIAFS